MQSIELLRVLRTEHSVVLIAVDRFVLGAVILEQRPDVLHAAYRRDISDEHHYPEYALDKVEYYRVGYPFAQEVHCPGRQYDEKHHRYQDRKDQGRNQKKIPRGSVAELFIDPFLDSARLLGVLLRSVLLKDIRGFHQRTHAVHKRSHEGDYTSDERYLCRLWLLALLPGLEVEFAGRQAHGNSDPVRALHHDTFHYRLTAYRGRAGILYENFVVIYFCHSSASS